MRRTWPAPTISSWRTVEITRLRGLRLGRSELGTGRSEPPPYHGAPSGPIRRDVEIAHDWPDGTLVSVWDDARAAWEPTEEVPPSRPRTKAVYGHSRDARHARDDLLVLLSGPASAKPHRPRRHLALLQPGRVDSPGGLDETVRPTPALPPRRGCTSRRRTSSAGCSCSSVPAVDEHAQAVEDPRQAELEGVGRVVRRTVRRAGGGAHPGGERVAGLVEDPRQDGLVRRPPLLIGEVGGALYGVSLGGGAGGGLDEAQHVGQGGVHLHIGQSQLRRTRPVRVRTCR